MEMGASVGMEIHGMSCSSAAAAAPVSEEEMDLRRGPWTVEEDLILVNYIANHGEGRWNSLAHHAGLKRTGKSCRLRWLNYLRPDVRRGNITPEEQLLILELHSRWGNRWSKIAQHLPGRTDNEIKNYWRTRVQKHAKQLQCDVNSKKFKDVMRYLWMPRLLERIRAASGASPAVAVYPNHHVTQFANENLPHPVITGELSQPKPSPESSSLAGSSSDSMGTQFYSPSEGLTGDNIVGDGIQSGQFWPESLLSPGAYGNQQPVEFDQGWWAGEVNDGLWNVEDNWFLQQ